MRIMILGGYGAFGQRISSRLARCAGFEVIIAGRSLKHGQHLCQELHRLHPHIKIDAIELDRSDMPQLRAALHTHQIQLLINTVGPFQNQDYQVAQTVIEAGVHYIDLADAREYVCGFNQLDALAKQHQVLAITGASTVPALTTAVIDQYRASFSQMYELEIGISPGNRAPRGLATIRAVLSYCGKTFLNYQNKTWQRIYGWQGLVRHHYPAPVGKRWLCDCDVPDQVLIPQRYPQLRSFRFRAGLELHVLHLPLWLMSWLTRFGIVKNWARHARLLQRVSQWLYPFGSDNGAMHVRIRGINQHAQQQTLNWNIIARAGDGPQIPCTPSIILAQKIAAGSLTVHGAYPATGMFSLHEFTEAMQEYSIDQSTEHQICANKPLLIATQLTKAS